MSYLDCCEWKKRTKGTKNPSGSQPYTYPSQGNLWCRITQVTSGQEQAQGGRANVVRTVIHIHNKPDVAAGDRLTDLEYGETYIVEGIHYDRVNDELVAECVVDDGRAI